jgi:hypothetical protein
MKLYKYSIKNGMEKTKIDTEKAEIRPKKVEECFKGMHNSIYSTWEKIE